MNEENKNFIPDEETSFEVLESNVAEIGETIANEPEPETIIQEPEINTNSDQPEIKTEININSENENALKISDKKGKRGRPPGKAKKKGIKKAIKKQADSEIIEEINADEKFPENKQIDQPEIDSLILLLNATAIPIGSKYLNKNAEECLITEAQMSEIVKLRPDSQFLGKSWFAYIGAIVGTAAANFIRASEKDEVLAVMKSLKNMNSEQRQEIRSIFVNE